MASKQQQQQQHVVAVPLPAQGHLNSLMRFCKLLVQQGSFMVTFVDIQFRPNNRAHQSLHHDQELEQQLQRLSTDDEDNQQAQQTLQSNKSTDDDDDERSLQQQHPLIRRVYLPIHDVDVDLRAGFSMRGLHDAIASIAPHLRTLILSLSPPVTCLLSDFLTTIPTQDVADQLRIPRIVLFPFCASRLLLTHYVCEGKHHLSHDAGFALPQAPRCSIDAHAHREGFLTSSPAGVPDRAGAPPALRILALLCQAVNCLSSKVDRQFMHAFSPAIQLFQSLIFIIIKAPIDVILKASAEVAHQQNAKKARWTIKAKSWEKHRCHCVRSCYIYCCSITAMQKSSMDEIDGEGSYFTHLVVYWLLLSALVISAPIPCMLSDDAAKTPVKLVPIAPATLTTSAVPTALTTTSKKAANDAAKDAIVSSSIVLVGTAFNYCLLVVSGEWSSPMMILTCEAESNTALQYIRFLPEKGVTTTRSVVP